MTPTRKTALALTAAALALTTTACGDSTEPGAADKAMSSTPLVAGISSKAAPEPKAAPTDRSGKGAVLPISTDLKKKPSIPKAAATAPKGLVIKDIVVGTGAEAKTGGAITVKYVGVDYKTGKQFDASWDSGKDFPFTLGQGAVIPGWDEGVVGMKVGGRRELVIPADKAYGEAGSAPSIGPNATLIFVIDLVKA